MRAALWDGPGKPLRIDRVEDPKPGPSNLLLRVRGCGICGSDLHMSELPVLPRGFVMGHEFSGEVVEVGREAVGGFRPGDRVCALPGIGCGHCAACLVGDVTMCPSLVTTGLGQNSGGFAEYLVAGSRETLRLPPGIDYRIGALVEPLAVGLHAVERAEMQPGQDVLVVGAGPVGAAVALWARHFGARHVVVSDFVAQRRELALALGATAAIDPDREEVGPAFERITGAKPRLVYECVGVPGVIQQCAALCEPRGTVLVAGVCMRKDPWVPATAMLKELRLQFVAFYHKKDFQLTLDLLGSERIRADRFITDVIALDALPAAFEALRKPSTQCKVIVEP
jgi:(R,R)-butanediol dehydrogenase/meso-butanediol dehydrogenase/diacetyl reductase